MRLTKTEWRTVTSEDTRTVYYERPVGPFFLCVTPGDAGIYKMAIESPDHTAQDVIGTCRTVEQAKGVLERAFKTWLKLMVSLV